MSSSAKQLSRFDARLPIEQKLLFEKAAYLGGYRNLTDFILMTAQEKAKEIIKESELITLTEKDSAIFFDAITNPKKPSQYLQDALKNYDTFIAENTTDND